jgi:hypothetical protein
MSRPKPSITEAEFAVLAKRTGLPLNGAKLAELYDVYGVIEQMVARVRKPRGLGAESATIFVAGKGRE